MDILFWSGGKDAYLAHEFYRPANAGRPVKLLTTYDETTQVVPHQNIAVEHIQRQAQALDTELILVGLPPDCPNDLYMEKISAALENQSRQVKNLVFGDWYLQDIRTWREQQFKKLGYHCRFPIWEKNLDELLPILLLKPVEIRVSAVAEEYRKFVRVDEIYNQTFVRQLPDDINPMGENGEFHTKVKFKVQD